MQKWTKQIELPADQTVMTLSQLMQQWSLPRRIRGQLRQNKRVLLNGNYQPVSTLIQPRDKVSFTFLATDFRHSQSGYEIDHRDHLDILYENPDFMIANKPGVLRHIQIRRVRLGHYLILSKAIYKRQLVRRLTWCIVWMRERLGQSLLQKFLL